MVVTLIKTMIKLLESSGQDLIYDYGEHENENHEDDDNKDNDITVQGDIGLGSLLA